MRPGLSPAEIARRRAKAAPFVAMGRALVAQRKAEGQEIKTEVRREARAAPDYVPPDPEVLERRRFWFRVRKPRIRKLAELRAQGRSVAEAAKAVGISESRARADLETNTAKSYLAQFAAANVGRLREGFDATVEHTVAGCKDGDPDAMDRLVGIVQKVDKARGFGTGGTTVDARSVTVIDPGRDRLPDHELDRLLELAKQTPVIEAEVVEAETEGTE